MLKASDFFTVIFQTTIFTPDVSAFSAPKLLATILGKYAQRYNGNVQALPLPEGTPPEFPRVILQSSDGAFKLEASPARVNSFLMQPIESQVASEEGIVTSCVEVLEHYVRETEMQVNRLALVLTRVYKTENPAQLLIERFCKPELKGTIFENSENFEIHNHQQFQIKDFSINNWVRCKTATLIFPEGSVPAVVVEQDLNTLAVEIEQPRFTYEDIRSYFQQALEEAKNTLYLYFPDV